MADGGHIEFRKNANINICTLIRTKMQHGADYGKPLQDGFWPTT